MPHTEIDPVAANAQSASVPDGYTETPEGLVVPTGTIAREQERWPAHKVDDLQRAARFAAKMGVALTLACLDPRCASNPLLQRVEVEPGLFVLICAHKARILLTGQRARDERRKLKAARPRTLSKAERKAARQR